MEILQRIVSGTESCAYLPGNAQRMERVWVKSLSLEEYQSYLLLGWRRFGRMLFRPVCRSCRECVSLRVDVERFVPNRSQRRVRKLNEGETALEIGEPTLTAENLALYDRYHAFQTIAKDWPWHWPSDEASFRDSFLDNPFPILEFRYRIGERLVGLGYVDSLPKGLSAIYFVHDPDFRDRSLGTWNVLAIIEQARRRGLPHAYLGYYVSECGSLSYKRRFSPNQVLGMDGAWHDFDDGR